MLHLLYFLFLIFKILKSLQLLLQLLLLQMIALAQSSVLEQNIWQGEGTIYNNANASIDNYKKIINNSSASKEQRFFAYHYLSKLYEYNCDLTKAKDAINKSAELINKNDNPELWLALKIHECLLAVEQNNNANIKADMQYLNAIMLNSKLDDNEINYEILLGKYHHRKADSMMYYFTKALAASKNAKNNDAKANCYLDIAKVLLQKKSLYDSAKKYLDSARAIATKNNFQRLNAQINLCDADILSHKNLYYNAIQLLDSCLQQFTTINDVAGIVETYKLLGNIETYLDNNDASKKYYYQGINISIKNNYRKLLPVLYQNIGNISLDHNIDTAKYYLEKGIELAKEQNDEHVRALATFNLSEYYSDKKMYNQSKAQMYAALEIFTTLDEVNNVSWVLPQIVKLELLQINEEKIKLSRSKSDELKALLAKALSLNADGNSYINLESIYNSYKAIAKLNNDYDTVSYYQEKLIALKDTVYKNERIKDAIETSERLKSTEQKLKIAKLEVDNTKSKVFNYTLLGALIVSILAAIVIYKNYRKKAKLKSEKMLLQQKEQFRNQLASDLHDDVGTMLTGLAMQSEMLSYASTADKQKELMELSQISKDAMEQMREIVWTLDSRKDRYENLFSRIKYLAEQQLNIKNIDHQFKIESADATIELSPEVRQNVYLIFKESIANILKHSNATFVQITITQTKEKTTLQINDNGTNLQINKSDGLGMQNMMARAKKINAMLEKKATPTGFSVTLIF